MRLGLLFGTLGENAYHKMEQISAAVTKKIRKTISQTFAASSIYEYEQSNH